MKRRTIYGYLYAMACIITLYQAIGATRQDLASARAVDHLTPVIPTLYQIPPDPAPSAIPIPQAPPRILTNPRIRKVAAMHLNRYEFMCLAKNIFHEAGIEPFAGKIAVGQVTVNRLHSGRWGHSICSVVYRWRQFSWTNSQELRNEIPHGELWEESKQAATAVMNGERIVALQYALFYHATYIETPDWASPKYAIAQVGQHIFYDSDVKL